MAYGLAKLGWPGLSGLLPPGSVYYAATTAAPWTWSLGAASGAVLMLATARWAMRRCERELRNWYSEHHGSMVLD